MARSFLSAFLAGDPAAHALLPLDFRDRAARAKRVAAVAQQSISAPLLAELRAQDVGLPPSAARTANLEALGQPGTVAVITGQQVGLFLGPLYTFYKAASAVAVARALAQETGARCVPLFWLQTEDHDFDEIAACHVLASGGTAHTIKIAADPSVTPRTSIAHHRLGPDVLPALAALGDALAMAPGAADVMAVMRAHYRPGVTLGRAFGGAIAELFADDGLVVFDPRNATVAKMAVPLYRKAIEQHAEISRALSSRKNALAKAGLIEQVPARPNCPLVFFHEGSVQGARYRLESAGGAAGSGLWALAGVPGASVSDEELRRCLRDEPLRFSTSALLRPLLQDTLFPTATYVGGPAEVGYFAQLGPLYDLFGLPQPLVALRARFRCVDVKSQRLLAKLGLSAGDVEEAEDQVLRKVAERVSAPPAAPASEISSRDGLDADWRGGRATLDLPTPAALSTEMKAAFDPALDRLRAVLGATDATLLRPLERRGAQIRGSIDRLLEKYANALARKDTTRVEQVQRLRTWLCPDGHPQERHYGWPTLAARAGCERFAGVVRDAIAPFSTEIKELCP